MIDDRAMTTLRVAATLGHALPGVTLRVHHHGQVILEAAPGVSSCACTPVGQSPLRVSPVTFHRAVARAHERRQAGEVLRFLGLGPGCQPSVEVDLAGRGEVRPGGIYRIAVDDRWIWVTTTTLEATEAYELGRDLVDRALPVPGLHSLGIRPDPATGVSVAFAELHASPDRRGEAAAVELLISLLARWTAHDLISSVETNQAVEGGQGELIPPVG